MSNIGEDLEKPGARLVSRLTRTNAYRIVDIDLTVARVQPGDAVGLKAPGFKFRSLITYRIDAAVTLRLNSPRNEPINLPAGILFALDDHDFEEIFVTNAAAGAGSRLCIFCGYNRTESQAVK